jgi:dihydropteroate synthase
MSIGLIESELAGLKIGDLHPARLMGVINLSQESFYKGSVAKSSREAVDRAVSMVEEGAEILDIGAMSTAPKVKHKTYSQERERLIPILKQILDNVEVPISIDTYRSKVADEALNLGANIINDISGFKKDPKIIDVLKDHDAPAIIMATDKKPGDPHTIDQIIDSLLRSINLADKKGYDTDKIVIDPGIGLWVPTKVYKYNLDIINNLERFRCIGSPILVGISRKSFIGDVLGRSNPFERLKGTLAATAIAVYNGAHIVRTHDVGETYDIVRLSQRLGGRSPRLEDGGYEVMPIGPMLIPDAMKMMTELGASKTGARIMSEKACFKTILIKNLKPVEASIIKQEMLARGGDVSVPKEAIVNRGENLNVLVMGTDLQVRQLAEKLKTCEPKSLKKVSKLLRQILKPDDLDYRYKYEFK